MPHKNDILDRRHFFSDRISSQVRIVSIGILATAWGLLVGRVQLPNTNIEDFNIRLIIVSTIAIVALFFDFLQYVSAYLNVQELLEEMDDGKLEEADYKYDWRHKASVFCFWFKQVVLLIAVVLFVLTIFALI